MRPAVAMFAIFTTGALSPALADPPPAPSPPEAATSQDAREKLAAQHEEMAACLRSGKSPAECRALAGLGPESESATAAEAPAVAPAKPAASDPDERAQERLLRAQGYKLTMVHGEEKYCRREAQLGSRLATVMRCVTLAEAEQMAREGRESTERIQHTMPGCLTPAMGGCGH